MWPFLIPGSVLDLYPLIFFLRTQKSCYPLNLRTDCLRFHVSLGCSVPFVHCKMRKASTTKIYLEQRKKHCPHDPSKDGNVSIWNVLQAVKIMNRWTTLVVLCAAYACSSKCWPPYSIKIRISAVFMYGGKWCAHNRIPLIGSTQFILSPLQQSPLPVLELPDAIVAQATLLHVWTVPALQKWKPGFVGTSNKMEISPRW